MNKILKYMVNNKLKTLKLNNLDINKKRKLFKLAKKKLKKDGVKFNCKNAVGFIKTTGTMSDGLKTKLLLSKLF